MNYYCGKTILVTGATGLIGSHLVEHLMSIKNARVIAMGRSEQKLKSLFKRYITNPLFSYIAQDVAKELPRFKEPLDIIFHAASPIAGELIKNNPVDVIQANIIGVNNFLEFLKQQETVTGVKGRLVIFSSAVVYANLFDENIVVKETDTAVTGTLDADYAPYSEAKRMIEVLAKAYYRQYGVDSVIGRLSYVYGFSKFYSNTAFCEFLSNACDGKNIIIKNFNMEKRDNIFVEDAVEGLLCLGELGKSAESYNISSNGELGNFCAIDEMAGIIVDVVNSINVAQVKVKYLSKTSDCNKRKPGILMDNCKIKELGWKLRNTLQQGITETVNQYHIEKRL